MFNQKGVLQIIVAVAIIAIILLIVLKYLNNANVLNDAGNESLESDKSINQSPRGIIDSTKDKIESIEDKKNNEIQDYLNY